MASAADKSATLSESLSGLLNRHAELYTARATGDEVLEVTRAIVKTPAVDNEEALRRLEWLEGRIWGLEWYEARAALQSVLADIRSGKFTAPVF